MKIVVDTNVVISGIFFGGNPRKIVEAVAAGSIDAYATTEIIDEYTGIIDSMIERKQGRINQSILSPLFSAMKIIEAGTNIDVCRDPDDNKFIECAVDAKALYIVSGDNDLLDIKEYDGIRIITAKEFCDEYLK
jgi:putative PIN family toxin of toxin-antitoxin system